MGLHTLNHQTSYTHLASKQAYTHSVAKRGLHTLGCQTGIHILGHQTGLHIIGCQMGLYTHWPSKPGLHTQWPSNMVYKLHLHPRPRHQWCYSVLLRAKLHFSAKTLVFGTLPLNYMFPDRPGKNRELVKGNSFITSTKHANRLSAVQIRGQNQADGPHGPISVPLGEQTWACQTILGITRIEGHHQFTSPAQSTVKASTASEPGFQQWLLNLGS